MRPTDRARRALRRAQFVLGTLAVGMAVSAGAAAADEQPPAAAPGSVIVTAELLQPSPAPEIAVVGAATPTPARWTSPGGVAHTGVLWADAGLAAGSEVLVAIDATGEIVDGHPEIARPWTSGLMTGIGTLLGCWAVLVALVATWHARLAARDDEQWTADWARVEPMWSGRVR